MAQRPVIVNSGLVLHMLSRLLPSIIHGDLRGRSPKTRSHAEPRMGRGYIYESTPKMKNHHDHHDNNK